MKRTIAAMAALAVASALVMKTAKSESIVNTDKNLGGADIGDGGAGSSISAFWPINYHEGYQAAQAILETTLDQYSKLSELNGDFEEEKRALKEGLRRARNAIAVESVPVDDVTGQSLSVTVGALERGINIANALEDSQASDPFALEASIQFLKNYYALIVRHAIPMDLAYFSPPVGQTPGCASCVLDKNELYAGEQIRFLVETFVVRSPLAGGYTALYSAEAFLRILEHMSLGVAADLDLSVWKGAYKCQVGKLKALNGDLALYNSGNHSVYKNDIRIALNQSLKALLGQRFGRASLEDILRKFTITRICGI